MTGVDRIVRDRVVGGVAVECCTGWSTVQGVLAEGDFWADGACVARGVVEASARAELAAAVDALDAGAELADLSALAGSLDGPRFAAGVDHWRRHDVFAQWALAGPLPRAVAAVLGTNRLWLYEDSVLVKQAGSTVATKWHTDDGYFHAEGRQMATAWVALDPSPREAGALVFWRDSHNDARRFQPTMFVSDDVIPGTEGEPPPSAGLDGPHVFGWDLEPGDVTIHHARTLHAASGNSTSHPRRAWSIRYCGVDAVVRVKPGAPAKPGFDRVHDATPMVDAAAVLGLPEADLSGSAPRR